MGEFNHTTSGEIGVASQKFTDLRIWLVSCPIKPFMDIKNIMTPLMISIYGVLELLRSHFQDPWLDLHLLASSENNSIISGMEIDSGTKMEVGHPASRLSSSLKYVK